MKRYYLLLASLFLTVNTLFSQRIYGLNLGGNNVTFSVLHTTTGDFYDISVLPNVQGVNGGAAYDVINNRYAINTNLGVTIINAIDGSILHTHPNSVFFTGMHFDNNNNLVGLSKSGGSWFFTSLDIETGIFTQIAILSTVNGLQGSSSTFDVTSNRYAIITNLGITIIDAISGLILQAHQNPKMISGIQFDCFGGLFGVYWNGNEEIFTSMDVESGITTDINELLNVQTVQSSTTYDVANNGYAINTNLGLTLVDASDGSIIFNYNTPFNFGGLVFESGCSIVVTSCQSFERE